MYLIETSDGERQVVSSLEGYDEATVIEEVDRMPEEFEDWDEKSKGWVLDEAAQADTQAGRAHKTAAHAQKAAEAAIILSGVHLDHGLVAEEAAAEGKDLIALAREIHEKGAAFREKEVDRRKTKARARSKHKT